MSIPLRAQIIIDIDATDFVSAADHQKRIESLMGTIHAAYDAAVLEIKERRPKNRRRALPPGLQGPFTGRLSVYDAD